LATCRRVITSFAGFSRILGAGRSSPHWSNPRVLAASTRSRIDQDQGAPNPLGSRASRRATGGSIAYEKALSQLRSHQRSHMSPQGLPLNHADDQPEDLQRTAGPGRLTRDQLGLALPVACTLATQIDPKPSLTSANAAKSDTGALSWQLVLTRRPASPLLTSNALTWGWAQLGSNQRPLACKDCHHHSPDLQLIPSAQVRSEQERAQPSTPSSREQSALPIALPPW
jgi:hypothetical protein